MSAIQSKNEKLEAVAQAVYDNWKHELLETMVEQLVEHGFTHEESEGLYLEITIQDISTE